MALLKLWTKKEPVEQKQLFQDIASRHTAFDEAGLLSLLPSPDPVLRRLVEGGAQVLEQLTGDAHVMSVVQTRKLGSLQKSFRILPGANRDGSISPASEAVYEALKADLENIEINNLINQILDAPLYGLQPLELSWEPKEGKARLKSVRALPSRWFGFDQDNEPRFISHKDGILGEKLPYGKFVFARHFPSYDNPYGTALLSRCLWPVSFKKGGIKFWVQLAEKYGMPFLVGSYPNGTTEAEQGKLLSSLANAVRDFVMIAPEGGKVEIKESSSHATAGIHKDLKDAMNDEISKVILGQNLTTEVKGGSFAASKTHADVLATYQRADQKLVEATINQIFKTYQRINDLEAIAPIFEFEKAAEHNQNLAERDKVLSDQGVSFSKSYYMDQYGLKPEDFELAE